MQVSRFAGPAAEWDAFVRGMADWTPFHLYAWRGIQEETFGHECVYLCARGAGAEGLTGVLPLVRIRSLLFGDFLVSMPFVNYGGPLGAPEPVRALTDEARRVAETYGVKLLELRCRAPLELELRVSHRKVTVIVDIPSRDPAALWKSLPAKVRSQVRRPQKEGMVVRFGPGELEPFYRVFARHMRDLGTPVHSRRFFEAMRDAFGDGVWFACVYQGARPVAGGCGFRWQEEFEVTWASALREYSAAAPNMLLYWSLMERCATEGVRRFNFGRCTPGSGTHRFKLQWGSREVQLHWYHHGSGDAEHTPSPDDQRYAWGPRLWRHLPLSVANVIGPHIVRAIP
jgi:FemAB-related protein (PEP-CTERM system-associated)